ncbi:MAG: DUF3810 domain-containing protein [Oscillospiraceae bacterium]
MKRFFKSVWIFIPFAAAGLMFLLLPLFPDFTEYVVSRGLFKLVSTPVGFVSSLLPFSLTELTVILALPALLTVIIIFARRLVRSDNRKKTLIKAARCTACFLSCACLMYMICHGANFYRRSVAELMELDTSAKTAEQLTEVCIILAQNAAQERESLTVDENNCVKLSESLCTELSRTGSGYEPLVEKYPWLWTSVSRQKPVMLSYWWSYTGITGMYCPFYVECNVNTEQPDYLIPFTAAHESAHSRGIAFEDECNFLAFLSCINSEYPEFRYSGYMHALNYCANELYAYDPALFGTVMQNVSTGMLYDFNSLYDYIDQFSGRVMDASSDINDTFIKVQGVADGELSYSRVTELILAYYYTEQETQS